jgi:hypothetical protein
VTLENSRKNLGLSDVRKKPMSMKKGLSRQRPINFLAAQSFIVAYSVFCISDWSDLCLHHSAPAEQSWAANLTGFLNLRSARYSPAIRRRTWPKPNNADTRGNLSQAFGSRAGLLRRRTGSIRDLKASHANRDWHSHIYWYSPRFLASHNNLLNAHRSIVLPPELAGPTFSSATTSKQASDCPWCQRYWVWPS